MTVTSRKVYLIKKRSAFERFFGYRRWVECKEYYSIDAAINDAQLGDSILIGAGVHKVKGFLQNVTHEEKETCQEHIL